MPCIRELRDPASGDRRGITILQSTLGAALAICLAILPAAAADDTLEDAHFVVGTEMIAADIRPFTTTVKEFGNGALLNRRPAGFEPRVYRTMFLAENGTADRILADRNRLSHFDILRTGALDGAEVDVLRIENGAFRMIRQDRIAAGGFQLGEWLPVTGNKAVSADVHRYDFAWARWNRSEVPYHFTVRAIDRSGQLSATADPVSIVRPAPAEDDRNKGKSAKQRSGNTLVSVKISDTPATNLPAPRNLRIGMMDDGVARLEWDPVAGARGYAVYRSDDPPAALDGSYIRMEGVGPAVKSGDLVILRHKFWQVDRTPVLSNRIWDANQGKGHLGLGQPYEWPDESGDSWQVMAHDTPAVPGGGEGYLRANLAEGQALTLGQFSHAGLEQSWYPVLDPGREYRFEAWIRGDASAEVRFELSGEHAPGRTAGVAAATAHPTADWTRFTGTFRVPQAAQSGKAGKTVLTLTGPGRLDVDNFRVFADQAPFLGLLPEDADRLKSSGMGALRLHTFGTTRQDTYDLAQLTNPAGASNLPGGMTLFQQMELTRAVGMDPWIQVEPHLSPAEWLGLTEFLAAPFDPDRDDPAALPWAAKRVAQGQARPWTEVFGRIQFEIGNETWNRLFAPWTFPGMRDAITGEAYSRGAVYGLYQEYVMGILRGSPYWPALEDRMETVLGGWGDRAYGLDAARHAPSADVLGVASYNGGWDEDEGPVQPAPQGFASVLSNVLQTNLPRALQLAGEAAALPVRDPALRLGTYEAGPGYALNGLNNTKVTPEQARGQELVMKSAAAGSATLDVFLALAGAGFDVQNYFAYRSGGYWASHARWPQGGQSYPSWDLLALLQREALGDMLAVETLAAPTRDLTEHKRRKAVDDAPLVAAYALRSRTEAGPRLSLVLISRRVPGYPDPQDDGHTRVTVDLPIVGAGRLTEWQLSGRYDSTNADGPEAVLEHRDLPVPGSLPRLTVSDLPPGKAVILVFDAIEERQN
jgi:hypothetical protein